MGMKQATTLSPETTKKIAEWAVKTGDNVAALTNEVLANMERLKGQPGLTPAQIENRARFMVYRAHQSAVLSTSVWFEAVMMGLSPANDVTGGMRRESETMKTANFNQALAEGRINQNGVVLDHRVTLGEIQRPNRSYGKPLLPFFIRTAIAAGRQEGAKDFRILTLSLRGKNANMDVPIGKPVKFRANIQSETKDISLLSDYARIQFLETKIDGLPTDYFALFDAAPASLATTMKDLPAWHEKNKTDARRLCFLEADVLNIGEEPNVTGNYTIMLTDMELDIDATAVPMFISEEQRKAVDFVRGSRISIVGRTAEVGDTVGLIAHVFQARLKLTEDYFTSGEEEVA